MDSTHFSADSLRKMLRFPILVPSRTQWSLFIDAIRFSIGQTMIPKVFLFSYWSSNSGFEQFQRRLVQRPVPSATRRFLSPGMLRYPTTQYMFFLYFPYFHLSTQKSYFDLSKIWAYQWIQFIELYLENKWNAWI